MVLQVDESLFLTQCINQPKNRSKFEVGQDCLNLDFDMKALKSFRALGPPLSRVLDTLLESI